MLTRQIVGRGVHERALPRAFQVSPAITMQNRAPQTTDRFRPQNEHRLSERRGGALISGPTCVASPLPPQSAPRRARPFDRICRRRCSATSAVWATDRVRQRPVVAPSVGSSNTGGATPSSCEARSPPLVDECAAPRWPRLRPKTQAHGGRSMSFYRGMTCESVTIKGDKGTPITAYVARPSGHGSLPGVVLVHHLPGWSEFYIETTRRFAHHGHLAICANLYEREGGGSDGNPGTTSPQRCARKAEFRTPRWSAIPKLP